MKKPIISVSGLRGVVGESLAPPIAMQYVQAFVSTLEPGAIVLTRDGRSSGPMLAAAIRAALAAVGRDVLYGDVAATPTTGVMVRKAQAAGGIQISASHNPPEYNGIKLFGPDGRVIGANAGQGVIDAMDHAPDWVAFSELGQDTVVHDTTSDHLELVLETVDVERIRSRKFKVVVDSNHGAGSLVADRLLNYLNCEVTLVGDTPDGIFDHPPEPTATNLQGVASLAAANEANIVFCQDPDADRLAIIDQHGTYIGEEYTLALTLSRRLMLEKGDCVINCATSRMAIDIAKEHGCKCHISAVGEANVCDMMQQVGAVYGGEGNGGPIDPKVGYVRDSFVGMAQILELMAVTGRSVSELVSEIPKYSIHKSKSNIDRDKLPQAYAALKSRYPEASADEKDGLRFDWPDRWLLVRPSNTEPIVRVICETNSENESAQLAKSAQDVIASI